MARFWARLRREKLTLAEPGKPWKRRAAPPARQSFSARPVPGPTGTRGACTASGGGTFKMCCRTRPASSVLHLTSARQGPRLLARRAAFTGDQHRQARQSEQR